MRLIAKSKEASVAFDKIYQTVLTACRALPAPSPLGNLRLELKAWHGAADAQKLVETLQATFSAADLLSAGVVRGSAAGDGEMVLHPERLLAGEESRANLENG